ncbi:hypothetical protein [Methanobrevibacter sp.]
MMDKRYFKREWDEEYYIFDSNIISEKEFDDRVQYEGYNVFADSMTQNEVLELLNENVQLKSEIVSLKEKMSQFDKECELYAFKLAKENEQLKQEVQELKQMNNQLLSSLKKGIFLPIQPEIKPPVLGPVGRCSIEPIEIKKEDAQEVVKKALEGIK